MPIRIPDDLPAADVLRNEGVMIMDESTATRQDIRPLQIGLLNLMPDKISTETQLARLIGSTPLQVELTLVRIGSHASKNTAQEHLISFYRTWDEIKDRRFDGFIITGAPIETLPFEEVTYWDELVQILDWTKTNVHSTFTICWGAMAALWHFHGVPKHLLDAKAFGVYRHRNLQPASPYLAGFSDDFAVSVSRWTEIRKADIERVEGLQLLMESDETGVCLISEDDFQRLYMFNHIEYDSQTLGNEYARDVENGSTIEVPEHYFPNDDVTATPVNRWRSHAFLLFGNWINQVYQSTPFDFTPAPAPDGLDHVENRYGQPVGVATDVPRAQLLPATPIEGTHCRLEPLAAADHAAALYSAYAAAPDDSDWTYLPYGPFESAGEFESFVTKMQGRDDPCFFAILDTQGVPVGMAAFLRVDRYAASVEVGHIHLSRDLQKTPAATEAMYLMMKHAFEHGYRRYEWKCDALNSPSRRAAERLGFTYDGTWLRATHYKGRNRDTSWYSIIDRDWPSIRTEFERWLHADNFDGNGDQRSALQLRSDDIA